MTDAFRCNGCGEYADAYYNFVEVSMDTDGIASYDFTLDDIPTEAYSLADTDDDLDGGGDYCPECGLKLLQMLVEEFGGDE